MPIGDDKVFVSLIGMWLGSLIFGIFALVIANANNGSYTGELKSAQLITETSCSKTSCSNTYYVGETFYKGSGNETTHTCLIKRLTPYYYLGDANNAVEQCILGTFRRIWETWYSHGTCYDKPIRDFWNTFGGTFLGLALLPFLIVLIAICWDTCKYWYESRKNSRHLTCTNRFETV